MHNLLGRSFPGADIARLDRRWPPVQHHPIPPEKTKAYDLLEETEHRFQDIIRNHQHQQETSEVILRQLENLLSLAFNTQAIAQGQAMASLNVIAAVFLPLSLVSSIFGMTQFDISAIWCPLAAIIVLVLVAVLTIALRYFSVDLNITRHLSPVGPRSARRPVFELANSALVGGKGRAISDTKAPPGSSGTVPEPNQQLNGFPIHGPSKEQDSRTKKFLTWISLKSKGEQVRSPSPEELPLPPTLRGPNQIIGRSHPYQGWALTGAGIVPAGAREGV
ncbi:hypothetical protein B0H67DRAFT_300255 [Lasiosphaeris hirsuta]|uniref:Magnesium transporter n=1 Tax=Lasiosphaeris hirsuta TaxID=260670 RepID=A0AA40A9I8_9PEZI|nr:hypothetical protein B0H67DRAFT_300255 [Lasiosphaeris hirsuta]